MIGGESHTIPDSFWIAFDNVKKTVKKVGSFKKPLTLLTNSDKDIYKEFSGRVGRQRVQVKDKSLDLVEMRRLGGKVK